MKRLPKGASPMERFARFYVVDDAGCWRWQGARTIQGYGRFAFEGRARPAHRWYYEMARGAVPSELDLDHLCRVRECVNPDHLEPVTRQVNVLRGAWPVNAKARTHCPNGHEWTPENTHIYRNARNCRACGRLKVQRQLKGPSSVCKKGHPFTEDNAPWNKARTKKRCRVCALAYNRAHKVATRRSHEEARPW